MDSATPGLDELEAIRRSHAPHAKIPLIILTEQPEPVGAARLARAGALGYVAPQSEPAELIEAVRTVHDGRRYVCRHLRRALEQQRRPAERDAQHPLGPLTRRERQVLRLLAAGRSTREIAAALGRSRKTVSAHRGHILAKLRLRNNAELTRFAIEHNLIQR
jgi:DNA-binding NarL/FixJ family response regulator